MRDRTTRDSVRPSVLRAAGMHGRFVSDVKTTSLSELCTIQPMQLIRITHRFGDLPILQTFQCQSCRMAFTHEAAPNIVNIVTRADIHDGPEYKPPIQGRIH